MKISKNSVLDFLTKCQIERGGYTGSDVAKLAKSIPVSSKALRKWINYWTSNDPTFKLLQYLGKQIIPLTLDDFILIDQRLKEKPMGRRSDILREINDNRQKQGKNPISQSTFYRFVNSRKESLTGPRELQWLILFGINVVDTYKFGRIFTSREHIFADGVNVRNLQRDLGMLIHWNSKQKGFDLDDLIQLVEISNRQKRVVRIVERGVTRVSEPNVSLALKSAELILLMSAIVNILNGKQSSKWRGMSPVSMENIALFVPA